jgi:hypothetical protein
MVKVQDVIQLDPEHSSWGCLLAIVDEVRDWGVICYAIHPESRGEPPSCMFMRCRHEHYVVVGRAEWIMRTPTEEKT